METVYRKRFSRDLPEGRKPVEIEQLTARRRSILSAFTADHKYLHAKQIIHLVKGSPVVTQWELRKLYDNGFLDRPTEQKRSENANYKPLVYERLKKGSDFIGAEHRLHRREEYAHELLDSFFMFSLKTEAEQSGTRLLTWDDIIASPHFNGGDFTRIKLSDDNVLSPDGRPFVITADNRSVLFLREIDRGTEPWRASRERASIYTKLKQYREFFARASYKQHNFSSCMVIFLTTRSSLGEASSIIDELFDKPPSWLLLKTTRDWSTEAHFPNMDGTVRNSTDTFRMLSEPYVRVGHRPFSLHQLKEVSPVNS